MHDEIVSNFGFVIVDALVYVDIDKGITIKNPSWLKWKKNYLGYLIPKIWQIWKYIVCIYLDIFVKHKP